ncbi:MAG: hypothetical protein ACKO37_03025 [Vampirovibrionales bacterium]
MTSSFFYGLSRSPLTTKPLLSRCSVLCVLLGILVSFTGCSPSSKHSHQNTSLHTLKPSTRLHISVNETQENPITQEKRLTLSENQWLLLSFQASSETEGLFIPMVQWQTKVTQRTAPSSPDTKTLQTWTFEATSVPWVMIDIAPMNPEAPKTHALVMQSFSGGTHCCNHVKLAPLQLTSDKPWVTTDIGFKEGTPTDLIDADHDGFFELPLHNDAYLYTFDAYASSLAPPELWAFRSSSESIPQVVTQASRYRAWLQKTLNTYLTDLKEPREKWRNGLWAGYVGWNALISPEAYDTAWHLMLRYYDKSKTYCPTLEKPVESCDEPLKPLPEVLAPFVQAQSVASQ